MSEYGVATAIDGTKVPRYLKRLPCGGKPEFDWGSGCAYRCQDCLAIIGSVGQSDRCKRLNKEEQTND